MNDMLGTKVMRAQDTQRLVLPAPLIGIISLVLSVS